MENKQSYLKSYADYLGINPVENWRIDEIQAMINSVKGYEHIKIVFEFFQNVEYKNMSFVCRIKLLNGNNPLVKHEWVIQNKDEANARVIAWNDATKILVRDIWLTAIDSFKNMANGN